MYYELSRRDDLESFGYMLILLATNHLPLDNIKIIEGDVEKAFKEIRKIKHSSTPEELCNNLPVEFVEYIK